MILKLSDVKHVAISRAEQFFCYPVIITKYFITQKHFSIGDARERVERGKSRNVLNVIAKSLIP